MIGKRFFQAIGTLFNVPDRVEIARFLTQQVSTGHCFQLQVVHFGQHFDAAHLLHNLLQDQQVKALLVFELVDDQLNHGDQLDRILFEGECAKRGYALQPRAYIGRVVFHFLFVRITYGHDDRKREHVV